MAYNVFVINITTNLGIIKLDWEMIFRLTNISRLSKSHIDSGETIDLE